MEGTMENNNRSAKILRYAALCAREMATTSTDVEFLLNIRKEKLLIEEELGMNLEEIINEARQITVRE
jgi:hypothetical protein